MVKERVVETNEGIQGEPSVEIFDRFAKNMRDKGLNNVNSFIKMGITTGDVLEIGPGPGYVGLEWLKKAPNGKLTGCEISYDMIALANRNAAEYGLVDRAQYVHGNCMHMPFENYTFDAVFSNGSMHEWEDPVKAFNEIFRVLKPEGVFCIIDMRRDVSPALKWLFSFTAKPKEIRPGYFTSLNASYTVEELNNLLRQSDLRDFNAEKDFFGLCVSGKIG
jgi:ubiquinone/menaquinone biosynthesis C-methylase UbiE